MARILLRAFPLLLASLLLIPGCMAAISVDREGISRTRRIAIVSMTLSRASVPDTEKNRQVLREGADRALSAVRKRLKSFRTWNVSDPASYQGSKPLNTLGAPTDAELSALLQSADERNSARAQLASLRTEWKERYMGSRGLPLIPRAGIIGPKRGKDANALARTVIAAQAVSLCPELKVDAVAFVEVSVSVSHPRPDAFVVKDKRTDGQVRMAQSLVIIDRTGTVIADLGEPLITDTAATEDYVPVYIGTGKNAVKEENIDLADPKGRVAKAFYSLINESADILFARLEQAVAK